MAPLLRCSCPKFLVASLTAIIRRSGVAPKRHTGSAPRGVLDVELGFLVVTQVPEKDVDTVIENRAQTLDCS